MAQIALCTQESQGRDGEARVECGRWDRPQSSAAWSLSTTRTPGSAEAQHPRLNKGAGLRGGGRGEGAGQRGRIKGGGEKRQGVMWLGTAGTAQNRVRQAKRQSQQVGRERCCNHFPPWPNLRLLGAKREEWADSTPSPMMATGGKAVLETVKLLLQHAC